MLFKIGNESSADIFVSIHLNKISQQQYYGWQTFFNLNNENEFMNLLEWEKKYQNPVEITEIIGTFIDNNDKYSINMWISLDSGVFININDDNADNVIKYIYERYPY